MQNILNKLIEETPCAILFVDNYNTELLSDDYARAAFTCWFSRYNAPFIEINDKVSIESQIACLLHEQVHAECYEKRCKCFENDDNILSSYSAAS